MYPMFSWPMITGALEGGSRYNFTSVPQIPATSIFNKALSCGISGMGNSRISVLLGATLTAASTLSTVAFLLLAASSCTYLGSCEARRDYPGFQFCLPASSSIQQSPRLRPSSLATNREDSEHGPSGYGHALEGRVKPTRADYH